MILLHEVTKIDILGKLPKDPATQPTIEQFISNVQFVGEFVHITFPPIPNGYKGGFVWNGPGGKGLEYVQSGQKRVYKIKDSDGFGFGIFKGTIGKNNVHVELPTGAVVYGAETDRENPTVTIRVSVSGRTLDTFGFKLNGKVYSPIRVIAEFLGVPVFWDSNTSKVKVLTTTLRSTILRNNVGYADENELGIVLALGLKSDADKKTLTFYR